VRYRKKKNFIAKLNSEGRLLFEQEEKQQAVWDFYSSLLGTASRRDFTLNLEAFHQPARGLTDLDSVITEGEVWTAIKSLPSDKAPGPDGFTGRFYKTAWQIIKMDFRMAVERLFHGDISQLHLLNFAYITLLPKKAKAIEVKDFRPISLIHSFAKVVTKLLANRLASKLSDLVSPIGNPNPNRGWVIY
jgi:hypothetical protein